MLVAIISAIIFYRFDFCLFNSKIYASLNKPFKPEFCTNMKLVCCCFIPFFINVSNGFNICKIWNAAIFINKWIIVQHIIWIFTEMHYTCFTYFISVFFISSVLFVLLTSAYHSFVKCFIPFCTHQLSPLSSKCSFISNPSSSYHSHHSCSSSLKYSSPEALQ